MKSFFQHPLKQTKCWWNLYLLLEVSMLRWGHRETLAIGTGLGRGPPNPMPFSGRAEISWAGAGFGGGNPYSLCPQ